MKAVLVKQNGGADQLYIGEYETPVPGDNELLVRVHATALNRADIFQREGKYPPPEGASPILGLEIAGTIAETGRGCPGWNVGDRVFGLLSGGGYAEYAIIPHEMAMPVPPGMLFEEAVAIPEVFLTAYQALYWLAGMEPDSHVLIHAGASGVGTAAIQLAKSAEAHPYVTASTGKLQPCIDLGAELAIDYRTEDFARKILDQTAGNGVDIIVDFIGAPYLTKNIETLATDGRIVILATLGGSRTENFDLRPLFRKRAQLITSTLRSRSLAYQISLTQDFAAYALPLFLEDRLKPVIDSVYDWVDVAEAHRRMESNANVGKIILKLL